MQHPQEKYLPIALVVAAAFFMEMLDTTIILTALPRMAESFQTTAVDLSMGVTAYVLAVAALLPASGWVSDRYGTRRVFLVAIAVFVLSSMWCGLCDTRLEFIVARTFQGIGASMMSPVGRLAMLRAVSRTHMARTINIGAMAALLGPMVGPPLGGLITDYWSWRWIFFINVPIGATLLWFVWRLIPEYRHPQPSPFDARGFVLNAGALVGLLYGLQLLGERGAHWLPGAMLTCAGVLLGIAAWRHAHRAPHPLVSAVPFRNAEFTHSLLGGIWFRLGIFAPVFLLPLLLQLGLGMSATLAGLYMLCNAATDVLAKLFIIRELRRYGHRTVLIWSASIYALFPLLLLLVNAGTAPALLVALMLFGGAARSFHMTSSNTLQLGVVPPEQLTGASTAVNLAQQVSHALAISLAALLLNIAISWRAPAGVAAMIELADFRWPLAAAVIFTLSSLIYYRRLPHAVAADVSGYQPDR